MRRITTILLAATAAAAVPAVADADTLETSAPGARNLTTGGGWQAWAAPADNGRWRLTLRSPAGAASTPQIPDFGAVPDPSIGSEAVAVPRDLLVVYSRCEGTSTTRGCDVYAFNLRTQREAKVRALATSAYSETAPSVVLGRWAFVRRGGGPRPGVYTWSRNREPRRLSGVLARETASNGARVAYTYNSSRGGGVAVRKLSGGPVWTPASRLATVPRSLLLNRYHVGWLLPGSQGARAFVTTRFAGSGGPFSPVVREGNRALPASTDSLGGSGTTLVSRYLDAEGVHTISPQLWANGVQ